MNIYVADVNQLKNFRTPASDLTFYDEGLKIVNRYRYNKVQCLKNEDDKIRSLAAGLLLNYATGDFFEKGAETSQGIPSLRKIDVESLIDDYNPEYDYEIETIMNGKPVYKDYRNINFSLSHSGEYALCGIGNNPVGIDIEGNRKINFRVSERFFSDKEKSWIGKDEDRFFRMWTLKEAYAKLTGEGIAKVISSIEFTVEDVVKCNQYGGESENINIYEYNLQGYRISALEYTQRRN
ncbi:MAG: 4'-phosphopantetheinyl transferase family protein [Lachnospira sp.]